MSDKIDSRLRLFQQLIEEIERNSEEIKNLQERVYLLEEKGDE